MTSSTSSPPASSPLTLRITEVRISLRDERVLKAFVSITLNGCFVVRGLKVIRGAKGHFVAMPARRRKGDMFQDIAHPITREFRTHLEEVVLLAYGKEVEERDVEQDAPAGQVASPTA